MNELARAINACAKRYEADLIGFGGAERFGETNLAEVCPAAKSVIALGFRVLRGVHRGIEEGTTYYQYSTNGVEVIEETVMPRALLKVSGLIEDAGFTAWPQRRQPCALPEAEGHSFEMDYEEIYHGRDREVQLDPTQAAALCGLGEIGMSGSLLTKEFGPFVRVCCVLTDAELPESPLPQPGLCDRCGACVSACPGRALLPEGGRDDFQCGAYYRGANREKNPFMPPDALIGFPDREAVLRGEKKLTHDEAVALMAECIFYPPIKQGYASSICGKACDRACYAHLEGQGKLTKAFKEKFERRPEWKLTVE